MGKLKDEAAARRGIIWALWNGVEQLLQEGAFDRKVYPMPIFRAAITMAVIDLNSAATLASFDGHRLDDIANVDPVPKQNDLGALLSFCAAATRHLDSPNNVDGPGIMFFLVLGPNGEVGRPNGVLINEFGDDTAIFWGNTRLYVRRNLLHALERIKEWYPTR